MPKLDLANPVEFVIACRTFNARPRPDITTALTKSLLTSRLPMTAELYFAAVTWVGASDLPDEDRNDVRECLGRLTMEIELVMTLYSQNTAPLIAVRAAVPHIPNEVRVAARECLKGFALYLSSQHAIAKEKQMREHAGEANKQACRTTIQYALFGTRDGADHVQTHLDSKDLAGCQRWIESRPSPEFAESVLRNPEGEWMIFFHARNPKLVLISHPAEVDFRLERDLTSSLRRLTEDEVRAWFKKQGRELPPILASIGTEVKSPVIDSTSAIRAGVSTSPMDGWVSAGDIANLMGCPESKDAIRKAIERDFQKNLLPDHAWMQNQDRAEGQPKILYRLSVIRPRLTRFERIQ